MALRHICLIVNYNLYESKRYFALKMAEAWQRQGVRTTIIDARERELDPIAILRLQPDLICSFNSIAPQQDQTYFWDTLQIPFLAILVDPSLYSLQLTKSPFSIISCVDRDDCKALASISFKNVLFVPHAVERELVADPHAKRKHDIVFIGSCYDYEGLRNSWKQTLPQSQQKVLDAAAEMVLSDRNISLQNALVLAWQSASLPPEGVDFRQLFYYLDNYTRGKDRVELIRSMKNHKVDLFGQMMIDESAFCHGWDYYLGKYPHVTLHPPVNFETSLEILKQSKICLNSAPFFKDGTHERIFTSLAVGALPLTSNSLYIQEQFDDGKELLIYEPGNWKSAAEDVGTLLEDESRRQEMALRGQHKVQQSHTWDNRVAQLKKELPPILEDILSNNSSC